MENVRKFPYICKHQRKSNTKMKTIEGFKMRPLCDMFVRTGEYEIDKERALKDSEAIAKSWIEAGIVEE